MLSKLRNAALLVVVGVGVSLAAALVLAGVLPDGGTARAQGTADKEVLDIVFDDASAYPSTGPELVPPNELTVTPGTDVMISFTSEDVNNGPAVPADTEISGYAYVPDGCQGQFHQSAFNPYNIYTVDGDINVGSSGTVVSPSVLVDGPRWVDVHLQTADYGLTEPVGIPQSYTSFFTLNCLLPGDHVFTFCNRADVKPPDVDPDPLNNLLCEDLTVHVTPPDADYKCYYAEGTLDGPAVDLETQFGVETGVDVGAGYFLCPPALKDGSGDLTQPHLRAYPIASSEDPDVTVNLTIPQWGDVYEGVEVGPAQYLAVPALKSLEPPPPPGPVPEDPHYKCYDISAAGIDPPHVVDLETQFGVEPGVAVQTLSQLCAPALKNGEGNLSYNHLACYLIWTDTPGVTAYLTTQFGEESGVIPGSTPIGLLCVPAIKEIVETNADKQVQDIRFDENDNYPNEGTELVPPNELTVTGDTDVTISVTSDDVNNGPFEPTDAEISFFANVPAGCQGRFLDPGGLLPSDVYTVDGDYNVGSSGSVVSPPVPETGPRWVDVHFQTAAYGLTEPVGVTQSYTRFFELQCEPGDYVFEFCNRADVKPPYAEAAPGDELLCEDLTVHVTPPDVDYGCYFNLPLSPVGAIVDLETQFGVETHVLVLHGEFLCPPASKDGAPYDPDGTHLRWYRTDSTEDPDVTVNLTIPQWGIVHEGVEVGEAHLLAVPALKGIDPDPPPSGPLPEAPHYKCYDALGGPYDPPVTVDLETQFGPAPGVDVGPLEYLCAPATKSLFGGPPEGNLNYNHLACYQIGAGGMGVVNLRTQFGTEDDVEFLGADLLCVPAIKEAVCAPGNDTDGDTWLDEDEWAIGTQCWDDCPDDPTDDALPPDFNMDKTVNILDVLMYKPKLSPNPYDARYDLTVDAVVNILDVLMFKPELVKPWPCV